jgi:hypothetical protein
MEELRLGVKDKQDARMALLRYYSSECMVHGAYLLALAVAFLGFVEFTPLILESVTRVVFPTFSEEFVTATTLSLIAGGFIVLFVYVLGRTVVWGYLRSAILGVRPKREGGVGYDPESTAVTFLLQLHEGCVDYVKKKHRFWGQFHGFRGRHLALIWLDLFIVFLIVSLLLLHL